MYWQTKSPNFESTGESISFMPPRPSLVLPNEDEQQVIALAQQLQERLPWQEESELFSRQRLQTWPDDETVVLVVDDYSSFPLFRYEEFCHTRSARSWARVRQQDVLISSLPEDASYHRYLSEQLALKLPAKVLAVEESDVTSRGPLRCILSNPTLLTYLQSQLVGQSFVIHPYVGSEAAWQLAKRFSDNKKQCTVLAPLPCVSRLVNNKNRFLEIVEEVLGSEWTIRWEKARTVDECVEVLQRKAQTWKRMAVRIDNGTAGVGTREVTVEEIQSVSTQQLKQALQHWLDELGWLPDIEKELQVVRWENAVIVSPSVHVWIPPLQNGGPVVEGVTDQVFDEEDLHRCLGTCTTSQPDDVIESIEAAAAKLSRCFQHLGYVGRCSYDVVVCLAEDGTLSVKFVECNGRWGAATSVLSLLNRLFGDFRCHSFWHQEIYHPKLVGKSLDDLLVPLQDVLYSAHTGKGWLLIHNPYGLFKHGMIALVTIAESVEQARERLVQAISLVTDL